MKSRRVESSILIAAGFIWALGVPNDVPERPDFVISVAITLGLLGSGALLLIARRWAATGLALALLPSCLANVSLYAISRDAFAALRYVSEAAATAHR